MKKMIFQLGLALAFSASVAVATNAQEPAKPAEPQKSVITKPAEAKPATGAKPAVEDGAVQSPSDINKPKPKPEAATTSVTQPAPAASAEAAQAPCASSTCSTGTCEAAPAVTTVATKCCKQHRHRCCRRSR